MRNKEDEGEVKRRSTGSVESKEKGLVVKEDSACRGVEGESIGACGTYLQTNKFTDSV